MRHALAVPLSFLTLLACSNHQGERTSGGSCLGTVEVTKGQLAGGAPGKAIAASAFYSFGPRIVLAGAGCGYVTDGGPDEAALIRLNLTKDLGPGTYQYLGDGGSAFQVTYAATGPYGGVYGSGPVSGTLTLRVVDPTVGVQGSYSLDFGGADILVGELIEEGTFVAPVCDLCGLGGTEFPDGGPPLLGAAGLAACDHLYASAYSRCGGPILPAGENARLLARFEQLCRAQAALPGSGVTATTLETCASDLELSPCGSLPQSCYFHGSLPGGSSCIDGLQCPGGTCGGTVVYSPEGPITPNTCGICRPVTQVGKLCGLDSCPADSICIAADPSASHPTYTCVAITQGGAGAPCDDLTALCQPGFYCAAKTCRPLESSGAACGICAPPLTCGPSKFCVGAQAGEPCDGDFDCAAGLGCIPDVAVRGARWVCAPVTWAGPGEPCSATARCLVGSCDFGILGELDFVDGGLAWETCPTVIPDGEPCTVWPFLSTTCDTFSECFEGACIPLDSVPCR